MKVLGSHFPRFVAEVLQTFLTSDLDLIHASVKALEVAEERDPSAPLRLVRDIFFNVELDSFEPDGEIDLESPQTIVRDLIYVTSREVIRCGPSTFDRAVPDPWVREEDDRRRAVHRR